MTECAIKQLLNVNILNLLNLLSFRMLQQLILRYGGGRWLIKYAKIKNSQYEIIRWERDLINHINTFSFL